MIPADEVRRLSNKVAQERVARSIRNVIDTLERDFDKTVKGAAEAGEDRVYFVFREDAEALKSQPINDLLCKYIIAGYDVSVDGAVVTFEW